MAVRSPKRKSLRRKDALELGKKAARVPVLAFDTLINLVKGRMKINLELTGYDELLKRTEDIVRYIVYALFSCVLFFGSCILATADIQPKTERGTPLIAVVGILFSIAWDIYREADAGEIEGLQTGDSRFNVFYMRDM